MDCVWVKIKCIKSEIAVKIESFSERCEYMKLYRVEETIPLIKSTKVKVVAEVKDQISNVSKDTEVLS